jgi:hypothetical protein
MPKDKDFKRRVRSRMRKTGEAYTAARSHLLQQSPAEPGRPPAAAAPPLPDDYSALAGQTDEAVREKTGRSWPEWVALLDAAGCAAWPHRDIAAHVASEHGVSSWWSQTVTVGYERIKGLREVGQRRDDGSFEAGKSKTFAVPLADLYRAFDDPALRARWLPAAGIVVRTAIHERSARLTWPDETHVELYFVAKGDAKSQLAVQHRKLADKADAEARKSYWTDRLKALGEVLGT